MPSPGTVKPKVYPTIFVRVLRKSYSVWSKKALSCLLKTQNGLLPPMSQCKIDRQSVRVCWDFKQMVNPVSKLDRYTIPRVEDLIATLSNGRYFTKFDLRQAYLQLPLDEQSRKFVVIKYPQRPLSLYKASLRHCLSFWYTSVGNGEFVPWTSRSHSLPGRTFCLPEQLRWSIWQLEEVLCQLDWAGLRAKLDKCIFMTFLLPT